MAELHQVLLDNKAKIPVQHPKRLVASKPCRRVVIMKVWGGKTWYWIGHVCNNTISEPYVNIRHDRSQF